MSVTNFVIFEYTCFKVSCLSLRTSFKQSLLIDHINMTANFPDSLILSLQLTLFYN